MELEKLNDEFSVCKVADYSGVNLASAYCFIGKTDQENSLVCRTCDVPGNAVARDDGWKGLRVCGSLAFSLIGIIADISSVLADAGIPLFAISTYNTDYVLVKESQYQAALDRLEKAGYVITG